nr:IS30 family transposase [Nitrosomonas supralitoralis]
MEVALHSGSPSSRKNASGVTAAVTRLLRLHKGKCYTMTFDNGKEFAEHQTIAAELDADVYFAHPYHSWERGLNVNSNGLLRQYFPKEMELVEVTQEQVQWAVDRLNHRPRKVLGFRTLHEIFFGKTVRYIKSPLGVDFEIETARFNKMPNGIFKRQHSQVNPQVFL